MTGYQERAGVFDHARTPRLSPAWRTTPATSCTRDDDDYLTFVGRADDVFKASDYRISPFELESVLIEHPAVAEAAVVPAPDADPAGRAEGVRRAGRRTPAGPRYRAVDPGPRPEKLAPYQRVRRLEFGELPKTISGKIRRVELRAARASSGRGSPSGARRTGVFRQRLRLDGSLMASITNTLRELAGAYLTEQCSVIIDAEPGLRQREPIIHPTRVGRPPSPQHAADATRRCSTPSEPRISSVSWSGGPPCSAWSGTWTSSAPGWPNSWTNCPPELVIGPIARQIQTEIEVQHHAGWQEVQSTLDSDRYRALVADLRRWRSDTPFTEKADVPADKVKKYVDKANDKLDRPAGASHGGLHDGAR